MRPNCINYGCGKPATYSGVDSFGNKRWRVHCGHCQAASFGKWPHAPGVTPYKTGKCSNADGHLGFACAVAWDKIPSDAKGMTEVDHIDGDSTNHNHNNLDELCPMCHKLKGQRAGDYNNQKRMGIVTPAHKKQVSVRNQFGALFGS